jgi:hypothetical protein
MEVKVSIVVKERSKVLGSGQEPKRRQSRPKLSRNPNGDLRLGITERMPEQEQRIM